MGERVRVVLRLFGHDAQLDQRLAQAHASALSLTRQPDAVVEPEIVRCIAERGGMFAASRSRTLHRAQVGMIAA